MLLETPLELSSILSSWFLQIISWRTWGNQAKTIADQGTEGAIFCDLILFSLVGIPTLGSPKATPPKSLSMSQPSFLTTPPIHGARTNFLFGCYWVKAGKADQSSSVTDQIKRLNMSLEMLSDSRSGVLSTELITCFAPWFYHCKNRHILMTCELPLPYDFHNYMLRSMDDEFRDIVGIRVGWTDLKVLPQEKASKWFEAAMFSGSNVFIQLANSSVLSQLASFGKVKKIFSHCQDSIHGGGIFAIGEKACCNQKASCRSLSTYAGVQNFKIVPAKNFWNADADVDAAGCRCRISGMQMQQNAECRFSGIAKCGCRMQNAECRMQMQMMQNAECRCK
ncbi:hypothetical protein RJ641_034147 [Dillenia turbinata]|uniref:Uncharacterized protein n=1 Tax=Dillenia turbinata TaxID=194707 RepID=A0AAN8VWN2_9MAGN